jgi:glycerophosphoryl diester phosphodiesterase
MNSKKFKERPKFIITIHRANTRSLVQKSSRYQGLEIDLRMTRDAVVVVQHDRRIKDGNGQNLWVDRMTYEEIKRIKDTPLLKFDDVLPEIIQIAKGKSYFMLDLDIKQRYMEQAVFAILENHQAFSLVPEIIVSSPDVWVLQAFDALNEKLKLGLTLSPNDTYDLFDLKVVRYGTVIIEYTFKPLLFRLLRRKACKKGIDYANIHHKLVDEDSAQFLHEQGLKILAYRVEEKQDTDRLQKLGVEGAKIDYV